MPAHGWRIVGWRFPFQRGAGRIWNFKPMATTQSQHGPRAGHGPQQRLREHIAHFYSISEPGKHMEIFKTTTCETTTVVIEDDRHRAQNKDAQYGRAACRPWQAGRSAPLHESLRQMIDNLSLPCWLKRILKKDLPAETCRMPAAPAVKLECLPTEGNAAKTIHDFQKKQLCGELLTLAQMGQMARTAYLTRKDDSTSRVEEDVQAAAKRYMTNDAALFRKMECAAKGMYDGRLGVSDYREAVRDGTICTGGPKMELVATGYSRCETMLPSESIAAKTINEFQYRQLCGDRLSVVQMEQMARTGYLTRNCETAPVPPEIRDAAKRFMTGNASLFRKMESAVNGRCDGQLEAGDYFAALKCRNILDADSRIVSAANRGASLLPSEFEAAKTIHEFQHRELRGKRLSIGEMNEIAFTGYLSKGGRTIGVSPEVQHSARRFMAGGAALFLKLESITDGKRDGKLSTDDFHEAVRNGRISGHEPHDDCYGHSDDYATPSPYYAARTMHEFQERKLGGQSLSLSDIDLLACTGYLFRDGRGIAAYPEVQAAAQRFMADDCELFKKMDCARDGHLGTGDFHRALESRAIDENCGPVEAVSCPDHSNVPSEFRAATCIHEFQESQLHGGRLSIGDMDAIARTRHLHRQGRTIVAPDEVWHSARHFMANDAALFRKIESATDGQCDGELDTGDYHQALRKGNLLAYDAEPLVFARHADHGLPSASSAAKTIHDLQMTEMDGAPVRVTDMDLLARTGYIHKDGRARVASGEEREAAKRFMADGGTLFRKMESATDGRHDGKLGAGDYHEAIRKGIIHPPHHGHPRFQARDSEYSLPMRSASAKTIHDFQTSALHGKTLDICDMDQMARCGFLVKDGRGVHVSHEERLAAKRFMVNDAAFFKEMESAAKGCYDGVLGTSDYHAAVKAGIINAVH
jgi:hypothetical protein